MTNKVHIRFNQELEFLFSTLKDYIHRQAEKSGYNKPPRSLPPFFAIFHSLFPLPPILVLQAVSRTLPIAFARTTLIYVKVNSRCNLLSIQTLMNILGPPHHAISTHPPASTYTSIFGWLLLQVEHG